MFAIHCKANAAKFEHFLLIPLRRNNNRLPVHPTGHSESTSHVRRSNFSGFRPVSMILSSSSLSCPITIISHLVFVFPFFIRD